MFAASAAGGDRWAANSSHPVAAGSDHWLELCDMNHVSSSFCELCKSVTLGSMYHALLPYSSAWSEHRVSQHAIPVSYLNNNTIWW